MRMFFSTYRPPHKHDFHNNVPYELTAVALLVELELHALSNQR